MKNIKCVVVGDGTVGKTCLLISYCKNEFPEDYIPTVFDNYAVKLVIGGEDYNFSLFDTAGQEAYEALRPVSYQNTHVFLVCYDVTLHSSYENVATTWAPELKQYCPSVPILLVGTKTDLRHDEKTINKLRMEKLNPLTFGDGEKLAKQIGAVKYVECSALTRDGLKDVMDEALLAYLEPPELVHYSTTGQEMTSCAGCCSKLKRSCTLM